MGQKQLSPQNSFTGRLEYFLTMKSYKICTGMTTLCYSRRTVSGLLHMLHATSKPCVAIIAAGFMPSVLRKATLSLGMFSRPRVQVGAVHLETRVGIQLQNSWNIEHLRKFYL